jgi:glutaredoxin
MKYFWLVTFLIFGAANAASESADPLLLAQADSSQYVVMYATSWCPYCKKARKFFRDYGVPYVEYDIEKNAEANRVYKSFGGQGVPVIFFRKRRLNGFSVEDFVQIYH